MHESVRSGHLKIKIGHETCTRHDHSIKKYRKIILIKYLDFLKLFFKLEEMNKNVTRYINSACLLTNNGISLYSSVSPSDYDKHVATVHKLPSFSTYSSVVLA